MPDTIVVRVKSVRVYEVFRLLPGNIIIIIIIFDNSKISFFPVLYIGSSYPLFHNHNQT